MKIALLFDGASALGKSPDLLILDDWGLEPLDAAAVASAVVKIDAAGADDVAVVDGEQHLRGPASLAVDDLDALGPPIRTPPSASRRGPARR